MLKFPAIVLLLVCSALASGTPTAQDLNYLAPFRNFAARFTTPAFQTTPSVWYSSNYCEALSRGSFANHSYPSKVTNGSFSPNNDLTIAPALYDGAAVDLIIDLSVESAPYLSFKADFGQTDVCLEYLTASGRVVPQCLKKFEYSLQLASDEERFLFLAPEVVPKPWLLLGHRPYVGVPSSSLNCIEFVPNTPPHFHEILQLQIKENVVRVYDSMENADDSVVAARFVLMSDVGYEGVRRSYNTEDKEGCRGKVTKIAYSGWLDVFQNKQKKVRSYFGISTSQSMERSKLRGIHYRPGDVNDEVAFWSQVLSRQMGSGDNSYEFLLTLMASGVPKPLRSNAYLQATHPNEAFFQEELVRVYNERLAELQAIYSNRGLLVTYCNSKRTLKGSIKVGSGRIRLADFLNFTCAYQNDFYNFAKYVDNYSTSVIEKIQIRHFRASLVFFSFNPSMGYRSSLTPLLLALLQAFIDEPSADALGYHIMSKLVSVGGMSIFDAGQRDFAKSPTSSLDLFNNLNFAFALVDDSHRFRRNMLLLYEDPVSLDTAMMVIVTMLSREYVSDLSSRIEGFKALDFLIASLMYRSTFLF